MIDRCDVVFHLAAAIGVELIVEQPLHTIETTVHGTEAVLNHANKKKLVFIASTSEVYGKSADLPFRVAADIVPGPSAKHCWAYRNPAHRIGRTSASTVHWFEPPARSSIRSSTRLPSSVAARGASPASLVECRRTCTTAY